MTTATLYGFSGLMLAPFNGMLAGWRMLDRLWCGWHNDPSPICVVHAVDRQVEWSVVGPVTGFGRRLGVVEEALQELAPRRPGEKLRRVQAMMQAIERMKEERQIPRFRGDHGSDLRPAIDGRAAS